MPEATRVGDPANPSATHVKGSPTTFINNIAVCRDGDKVVSKSCGDGICKENSPTVFVNNKKVHRVGDLNVYAKCEGDTINGSPTTNIN